MPGYSHSPIYNKVNGILQQQQHQSYSDLTREVNILQQQQQQQSYSELARQVAMLPPPCYSDSGSCRLGSSVGTFWETVSLSLHSDSTTSQSAKVCSFFLFTQFIFITFNFPTIKTHLHLFPALVFMSPSYLSCAGALGAQHMNRADY